MRALEPWHLLVLLAVVLVLFGGKRLPEAARGLGRSMRIFKSEVKEMREDDGKSAPAQPVSGRVMDDQAGAASRPPTVEPATAVDRPASVQPNDQRPAV